MRGKPTGGEEHGLDQEQVELDLVAHLETIKARCDWLGGSSGDRLDLARTGRAHLKARMLKRSLNVEMGVRADRKCTTAIWRAVFERGSYDHRRQLVVEWVARNDCDLEIGPVSQEGDERGINTGARANEARQNSCIDDVSTADSKASSGSLQKLLGPLVIRTCVRSNRRLPESVYERRGINGDHVSKDTRNTKLEWVEVEEIVRLYAR